MPVPGSAATSVTMAATRGSADPVSAGARVHLLPMEGALQGAPCAYCKGGVHVQQPPGQQVPQDHRRHRP